jgi:gas vesicle protein
MKILYGFLVGALLGGISALLLAPMSGQDLRNQMRAEAEAAKIKGEAEWQKQRQALTTSLEAMTSDDKG